MSHQFERLLEPGRIGSITTRNRMVKSGAAARYWGSGENQIDDFSKNYYEALARGGIGLLIVEGPLIEPEKGRMKGNYRLDDDKYIKGVAELTGLIHKHGCPAFVQLNHNCNWQRNMDWNQAQPDAGPPRGASPVCVKSEMDNNNEMPVEITIEELQLIKNKIGELAIRLEKAGFDGIEVNAASTHLIHSFLSPFWNKRQDAYGGSLGNRSRFLVEIIHEIKKRLGSDYPVSVIINGIEMGTLIGVENSECLTLEENLQLVRIIQSAGADAIQVRSQWLGRHDASFLTDHFYYPEPPVPPRLFPRWLDTSHRGAGANLPLAAAIKKVVDIPVMTVGRLDPVMGEKALRAGQVDFVAFTRRLIADPELPNKIASGRLEDIAPCTACATCKMMGVHRRCRINGAMGTDKSYVIEPAAVKKKIVVIGGGPAGMETARVASLRGHKVVLFEKSNKLGGLLPLAAVVKGLELEDLPAIIRYMQKQLDKQGVEIRLGREAKKTDIIELNPDIVVLANGGTPAVPEIPGIESRKVVNSLQLHHQLKLYLRFLGPAVLNKLTRLWLPLGKKVVIIGGGIQGCELAEFLVKRGREVTIVDTAEVMGEGMVNHLRLQLFAWFREKGVKLVSGVKRYVEINDKGLVVLMPEGYNRTLKADSIVPALPLQPNTSLLKSLEGIVPEIYTAGDCMHPNLIVDAIGDGYRIGRSI